LIQDDGSTHGTFVNDLKLEKGIDTPLLHGDILRFGVNVDRGQGKFLSSFYLPYSNPVIETFEAIQVRYEVEWAKTDLVVLVDDTVAPKTTLSPSTNTFSVPDDEDDSDSEHDFEPDDEIDKVDVQHIDIPSDDSKESVARSLESANLHPADTSSVSSMDKFENQEPEPKLELKTEPKFEPKLQFQPYPAPVENLSSVEEVSFGVLSPSEPRYSDPMKSLPSEPISTVPLDIKPLPIPTTDSLQPASQKTDAESLPSDVKASSSSQTDKFPETCYQKVPEDAYSNWTMMRPMFMRLADMAWGESDQIPDVDYKNRIIHAARRCSLSRESYWVDDSRGFQPWVGTEVMWTPDSNASDTSFHRMPGNSLKYWAIDKRRYWIIYEDEDGMDMSNWWWIVEKPWGVLSDEIKDQLTNETEVDDRHKCWFVRAWEPQVVGSSWCKSPPYWNSTFDEELPSGDESVDSDDVDQEIDGEEDLDDSANSELEVGEYPFYNFKDESYEYNNEDYPQSEDGSEVDDLSEVSDYSSDIMEEDQGTWDNICEGLISKDPWGSEDSEESASDGDPESPGELEMELTDPPKSSSVSLPEQNFTADIPVKRCRFVDDDMDLNDNYISEAGSSSFQHAHKDETTKLQDKIFQLRDDMTKEITKEQDSLHPRTPLNLFGRANIPFVRPMKNPDAQFPEVTVSRQLPSACQDPALHLNPASSTIPAFTPASCTYKDGPFSIDTNLYGLEHTSPSVCMPNTGTLKRTASQMESPVLEDALPDPDVSFSELDLPFSDLGMTYSQDAQRVPLEPISQPDLQTTSIEVQEAITSALAENDRPAKRLKSNHSPSKSLASYATTAVVGAVLGSLGTIAMLAALPNEYFQ
jgi:hypothetical protein